MPKTGNFNKLIFLLFWQENKLDLINSKKTTFYEKIIFITLALVCSFSGIKTKEQFLLKQRLLTETRID
jgi:hypothetical protein